LLELEVYVTLFTVKLIGIVLKDKSRKAAETCEVLKGLLKSRSIDYLIIFSREGDLDRSIRERIPSCDLAVAFGGDGTLLFASRIFSQYGVPIIGIHIGGLGFITEFRESEVIECIECFISGQHTIEKRMMVDVLIYRNNRVQFRSTGLNDIVINTGGISRLLELEVSSGVKFIGTYRADGIIIATPTGSTAYSLSAGGPIIDPTMKAFIISPICPHTLGVRPLVLPSEEDITVRVLSKNRKITATIDGQVAFELEDGDEVHVVKSEMVTKLISLGTRSFYDIVREKFAWKG